ncbi:MAG: GHMP kinase, partial [Candidatus Dormibacteraeota bacterium]|nr:GHMP kinase [Candidatus Dormibacteraeota bacterium]
IKAMAVLSGESLSRSQVAELACDIEINRLGMPIGKQDQYAAAFGGVNFIQFAPERVSVERLAMPPGTDLELERRLLLFFTGRWHNSASILSEQRQNTGRPDGQAVEALHLIKDKAIAMRSHLLAGEVSAVGALLHESWLAKRTLARGITDPVIDRWYQLAMDAGAGGGKLTGAGGGGFLLLHCEPERQDTVTEALGAEGLVRMDFRFESGGGTVILNNLVGSQRLVALA